MDRYSRFQQKEKDEKESNFYIPQSDQIDVLLLMLNQDPSSKTKDHVKNIPSVIHEERSVRRCPVEKRSSVRRYWHRKRGRIVKLDP